MSKKSTVKKDINKSKPKKRYKVRNWSEYNKALIRRGSLEFWIEQGMVKDWEVKIVPPAKRKRGGQKKYSSHAIESCRMMGKVYHQPLRQTEGLVNSIFKQAKLSLIVPDYSTMSRRGGGIKVRLPVKDKEKVVAILDSTGLKVYGEGEWKVRKHGYSKRRTWLKLHVSVDEDGEIRAALITNNSVDDAEAGIDLLNQQQEDKIEEVDADGAYDKQKMYKACVKRQVKKINIPPRRDAKIWFHGNRKGEPHPRDQNLRAIRKTTRQKWKADVGYHKRSLVETTMYREKVIFGDKIKARKTENQITEIMITLKALNYMTYNGMPDSYPVP